MTKNRTPTPVYLDPGMHSGLEVKGLINYTDRIIIQRKYFLIKFTLESSHVKFKKSKMCPNGPKSSPEYKSIPLELHRQLGRKSLVSVYSRLAPVSLNPFTTIHDGNFRRHSSMNVTIK